MKGFGLYSCNKFKLLISMALYENILVNFEVETLIKKVLGFLQTADQRRAYNFISGHMKMIMAVLRSVVDLGITNMSPQLSMYSLYHISTSGIRGWPNTRASREGMRACGVGQSDTARLELIWSSADYGVDTGLAFELSLHGDKVHITITRNPMSTVVGCIQISRAVVAHAIRALNGHDGWRLIVASSALFHAVSRLSSVSDGVFIGADIIRRSTTSIMCYGSPFDCERIAQFASIAHDLDWGFKSVCDARSLLFQCLEARLVYVNTGGLGISIPASLVQYADQVVHGTTTTPSLNHSMLRVVVFYGPHEHP